MERAKIIVIAILICVIIYLGVVIYNQPDRTHSHDARNDTIQVLIQRNDSIIHDIEIRKETIVKIKTKYDTIIIFVDVLSDSSLIPYLRAKLADFDSTGNPQNNKMLD